MPKDDFERQMSFIIEQQAKFSVDIQKLQESQARTTEDIRKLQEAQARTVEAQERTDGMIRQLIDVNLSLVNHVGAIDERLLKLAESQVHTDRRLDALIDVVDKLTRRNGGAA